MWIMNNRHLITLNGVFFEIGMREMNQTFYGQIEESAKLDEVILENLEVLDYGE